MRRRTIFVRFLALLWATLQLASPGVSAIADGRLAGENASGPASHVEATTTASCPVVHSPDCGICRYLSGSAMPATPAAFGPSLSAEIRRPTAESCLSRSGAIALPFGRAPPIS